MGAFACSSMHVEGVCAERELVPSLCSVCSGEQTQAQQQVPSPLFLDRVFSSPDRPKTTFNFWISPTSSVIWSRQCWDPAQGLGHARQALSLPKEIRLWLRKHRFLSMELLRLESFVACFLICWPDILLFREKGQLDFVPSSQEKPFYLSTGQLQTAYCSGMSSDGGIIGQFALLNFFFFSASF